jgi:hypothetical protein
MSQVIVACTVATVGLACTSVQWVTSDGAVRVVGLGRATTVRTQGGAVTRVVAPGLPLGLVPNALGWTVGYRASTVYQSVDANGAREIVAVGDVAYGLMLGPTRVAIGSERRFGIVMPSDERSVEQELYFENGEPSSDWLRHREVE